MLEKASVTAASTASGAELIRFLDQAFVSHAGIGNGTEQSFRAGRMMARKAGLPQGTGVQIPPLGMRAIAFLSHGPTHALLQQAILSTHFSSLAISGMIAANEENNIGPAPTGLHGRASECPIAAA